MKIYSSYEAEPEPVFTPLTEKLYSEFYSMEMDGFEDDINFYNRLLPTKCSILELGCGTGRIASKISSKERNVVGVDISLHRLKKAEEKMLPYSRFICMDIRQLAFTSLFDQILIPYNTINLLVEKNQIISCLKECSSTLAGSGRLYLQLYIPDRTITSHKRSTFQFQMFDRVDGGKIIKEILKNYSAETATISIEERYRVRPMQPGLANQDWNHIYSIAAFSYWEWLSIFKHSGFRQIKSYGGFDLTPFDEKHSSSLLAVLETIPRDK